MREGSRLRKRVRVLPREQSRRVEISCDGGSWRHKVFIVGGKVRFHDLTNDGEKRRRGGSLGVLSRGAKSQWLEKKSLGIEIVGWRICGGTTRNGAVERVVEDWASMVVDRMLCFGVEK